VEEDSDDKFCCDKCGCDVASASSLIWEGFMEEQKPALLLRSVVNVEPYADARRERLSTGEYGLVDVCCRVCSTPLGWQYLDASVPEQKYKEGASLLSHKQLRRKSAPIAIKCNATCKGPMNPTASSSPVAARGLL